MAFALSVIKGERAIDACPYIEEDVGEHIRNSIEHKDWKGELITSLSEEVSRIDLVSVAEGIGAGMVDGRLNIRCLGMEFDIDSAGGIHTKGHINPWIQILLLHYVRTGGRSPLTGTWVSFDELKGGMIKVQSFKRECEEPLREIIDREGEHFFDLLGLLYGRTVQGQAADSAWIIYPLPRVPFLILYWSPDEDYGSTVKILFDSTADEYLDVESLIFLGEGLVKMFKRIMSRHE
jgi:hypothetical protein